MSDYIETDNIEHYGYDSVDVADMNSEEMAEPQNDFGDTECDYCGEIIEKGTEYRGANRGDYHSVEEYIEQVTNHFEPNMWEVYGSDFGIEKISDSHYVATKLWNENYLRLAERSFSSLSETLDFITSIIKKGN